TLPWAEANEPWSGILRSRHSDLLTMSCLIGLSSARPLPDPRPWHGLRWSGWPRHRVFDERGWGCLRHRGFGASVYFRIRDVGPATKTNHPRSMWPRAYEVGAEPAGRFRALGRWTAANGSRRFRTEP